ncbi:enoyl-CoA hydratase-related protein [Thiomonas sp. FB-Cd]|uniref:enoyl-CoA hydratase-related protein n=1 Tax=Thiomonas sp. FB-Cd TaxID=1158292 RepID=UPI00068AFE43|nr:enoyl-CoA hydratase-related protein [Thiomonas sp. FB-Cd]
MNTPDPGARVSILNLQLGTANSVMTPAMAHAGIEALSTALRDPDIRVIVLTGSDEQFCLGVGEQTRGVAGAAPAPADTDVAFIDALHDWLLALHDSDKPVIAAVEGEARGAGLALALACDLIVASRNAQFSLPVAAQLSGQSAGALWFAAQRLAAPSLLSELLLLDTALAGERAHQLGLVCRLADPGLALQDAVQLAEGMARHAPTSFAVLKQQILDVAARPLHEALSDERNRWLQSNAY